MANPAKPDLSVSISEPWTSSDEQPRRAQALAGRAVPPRGWAEQGEDSFDHAETDADLARVIEIATSRIEAGEPVDVEQLAADHPSQAEAIRKLLPALRRLVELHRADQEGAGPAAASLQSKLFGSFRILREIGRGGMGVVYEAEQVGLSRRVALKVLPMAAVMDHQALKRFQLEAQVAGLLQHPRIVPVYDVGTVGELPYFAMRYIEGCSLADVLAELRGIAGLRAEEGENRSAGGSPSPLASGLITGQFTPARRLLVEGASAGATAVETPTNNDSSERTGKAPTGSRTYIRSVARVCAQVAEALGYAHDQGIIHRDVKPANLLLDRLGDIWVADFGMADVQGEAGLTMTGDLPGTLRYMSPEQAMGKRALIDRRTDVYSLGATLYELLTLRPAVAGTDRQEIFRRIAEEEPIPLRKLNPAVPVDLATIAAKGLAKDPLQRYETAWQLADDLSRFLDGRPIAARPVGPLARTWRWCCRKPVQAALAASLVLALSGGFAGVTWHWWIAQSAEKKARAQAARADAINQFLIDKLLGQASPNNNPDARALTLHQALGRAGDEVAKSLSGQPEIEAAIRMAIAKAYHDLGDFSKSETHYRAAYDIYRGQPESSAESRLEARNEVGHLLRHLKRYDEAEEYGLQAVAETLATLGRAHKLTLDAMGNLADLYRESGRLGKAEDLYRSNIAQCQRFLGRSDPQTLTMMNNLGTLLMNRQKYAEAEALLRECMERENQVHGPEHPNALATTANLAEALGKIGREDEAEALLRRCLDMERRVLGPDHPYTSSATERLDALLKSRGQVRSAHRDSGQTP